MPPDRWLCPTHASVSKSDGQFVRNAETAGGQFDEGERGTDMLVVRLDAR